MELGKYTDGRALNYDENTRAFTVGEAPVTLDQVHAYDGAGQITWASDETRQWTQAAFQWVGQTAAVTPVVTQSKMAEPWFRKWWVWAVAALLLVSIVAAGNGGGNPTDDSKSGKSAATSDETPPVQDTAEQQSPELTEPTPDPVPEPAPKPEPAVTPAKTPITAQEAAYALKVADINETAGDALLNLSRLLSDDPVGVLSGGEVTVEAAVYAGIIQGSYTEAAGLTPPASMKPIHAKWLGAMKDYYDAMDHLAKGVDNMDADEMQVATDLMSSAGQKMNEATALLTELQATKE